MARLTEDQFKAKYGLDSDDLDLIKFICINSGGKVVAVTEKQEMSKFVNTTRTQIKQNK